MNRIDTVIFDLDGTLLDTLGDLSSSVNFALRENGLPQRSVQEIRNFLGNGIRTLMMKSVGEAICKQESRFEVIFQCFRSHYIDHCLDTTKPYDGILPMLGRLKKQNINLAIVSNKLQEAVTELNNKFFSDYVSVAIGESLNVRRKPFPDTVNKALDELKSNKAGAVYVGDSEVDIETANAAQIPCLSVLWGFRDEEFMRKKFPHASFVKSAQELEQRLQRLCL